MTKVYIRNDSYRDHSGFTATARLSRKMLLDTHCLYIYVEAFIDPPCRCPLCRQPRPQSIQL